MDAVDEEEEETEIQVDHMLNNDIEDDDQPPPIPHSHVYNLPQHMTNMDLHDDETSNSVFYNPYLRSKGELKVGDMFRTKEECLLAIKKFHMNNSTDFTVKHTDSRRYVIECRNMLCKFHLAASYKKKNDSWEIASIDPPHSCIATNIEQDHRKQALH